MNEVRSAIAGTLAALVIVALGACTSTPTLTETARVADLYSSAVANGHAEQAARLEDGKVTRAELDDSLDDFDACLTSKGLTYEFRSTNPVDGWRPIFDVFWPEQMDWDEGKSIASDCDQSTWMPISWGYELTNPAVMDEDFRDKLAECVGSKGLTSTGRETNLTDFIPLGAQDPNATLVVDCANAVGAQYPYGIMLAY